MAIPLSLAWKTADCDPRKGECPIARAARQAAQDARILVAKGEHLTVAKRVARVHLKANADSTFATVAGDWMASESKRAGWTEGHRVRVESSLRTHLAPLNTLPVAQITAPMVAPLLQKLETSIPDMAAKVRQRLRAIMDFCVEQGIINGNPIPARRRHAGACRSTRLFSAQISGCRLLRSTKRCSLASKLPINEFMAMTALTQLTA